MTHTPAQMKAWRGPRRHPAEVTAGRIVDHMRVVGDAPHRLLTDDDRATLNSAAHVLYRLAERARTQAES